MARAPCLSTLAPSKCMVIPFRDFVSCLKLLLNNQQSAKLLEKQDVDEYKHICTRVTVLWMRMEYFCHQMYLFLPRSKLRANAFQQFETVAGYAQH